jgi:hypothetical protein
MSGIITVAAGVLLASYISRKLDDPAFRRHLLIWWVVIPAIIAVIVLAIGSR